jgi:hypothetical protein
VVLSSVTAPAHVKEDQAVTSLTAGRFLGKKASPQEVNECIEGIASVPNVVLDPAIK